MANAGGVRRLDDPDDFVRIEIASALSRPETLTIPVLLDGAAPSSEDALPADLAALARRQFVRLSHEGFRSEVQGLVTAIGEKLNAAPPPPAAKPSKPLNWRISSGIAAVALIGIAGFLGWEAATAPPDPSGTPDLAVFRECSNCPEMIAVPAGSYLMGSAPDDPYRSDSEGPQRQMTIPKFALAKTELKRLEYDACAEAGACEALPRHGPTKPDDPATHVRWVDAQAYVAWLNTQVQREPYRLPSKSEWEYAARAGTTTAYGYGNDKNQIGDYAWWWGLTRNAKPAEAYAHKVGTKKPNPWGLYDMHGNLWEFCSDWFDKDFYATSPKVDPENTTETKLRAVRGGSWHNGNREARCAFRASWVGPKYLHYNYGFRVVVQP